MGTLPFVMVLLNCGPNAGTCEAIATMPVAYPSEATCLGARAEIVSAIRESGFARVRADCRPQRPGAQVTTAAKPRPDA